MTRICDLDIENIRSSADVTLKFWCVLTLCDLTTSRIRHKCEIFAKVVEFFIHIKNYIFILLKIHGIFLMNILYSESSLSLIE